MREVGCRRPCGPEIVGNDDVAGRCRVEAPGSVVDVGAEALAIVPIAGRRRRPGPRSAVRGPATRREAVLVCSAPAGGRASGDARVPAQVLPRAGLRAEADWWCCRVLRHGQSTRGGRHPRSAPARRSCVDSPATGRRRRTPGEYTMSASAGPCRQRSKRYRAGRRRRRASTASAIALAQTTVGDTR